MYDAANILLILISCEVELAHVLSEERPSFAVELQEQATIFTNLKQVADFLPMPDKPVSEATLNDLERKLNDAANVLWQKMTTDAVVQKIIIESSMSVYTGTLGFMDGYDESKPLPKAIRLKGITNAFFDLISKFLAVSSDKPIL